MEYDAIKIFGWTRRKISSKKKPLDVELIFSPPRRILAQLTEAVSVKAVCAMLANAWRFTKKEKEEERFINTKYHPDSGKGGQNPTCGPFPEFGIFG